MSGPTYRPGSGAFLFMAAPLSPRLQEALTLAACGYTDIQTARRMCLSVHTVRGYWRDARRRLGAANTTQAVSLAWFLGLINFNTFIAEMAIQQGARARMTTYVTGGKP